MWSPSNLPLLFVGMLSDLLGEKDVFDQLGGLAVQTISVPVLAVDLLCDPPSVLLIPVICCIFLYKDPLSCLISTGMP